MPSDPGAGPLPRHTPAPYTPLGPGREFDVVRALLARWGDVARGVGDDAAVLDVPPGERLVVSTDASVEDVHFRRAWLTPEEIGWRAAAAALSDLAAMGARPLAVIFAAAVPPGWRDAFPAVADGVGAAVRAADAVIAGGDLTAGRDLALTLTVLGATARPVLRSGARPGDALYVTGVFGGPTRALHALQRGTTPASTDRRRFAHPEARVDAGRWLAEHGASAMIDVSDGLVADLGHIAAASSVRCLVDASHVPRVPGASLVDALSGGEEYELACAAPDDLDVEACRRATGATLTRVGRVHPLEPGTLPGASPGPAPGVEVRDADGARVDLPSGHDHFSRAC